MEATLCDSKSLSSDQDGTNDQANIAIRELKIYQKQWSINVRVLRNTIDSFKNGEGNKQKLILIDEEGTLIQAILFNKLIEKFSGLLIKEETYTITNGEVKPPNLKYPTINPEKELTLTTKTIIRETKKIVSLEKLKPTFLSFKDVSAFDDGIMPFDVVGFVITVKPIFTNPKSKRREVIIMNKERVSITTKSSTLVLVNPEIPQCSEMIDWLKNSNSESSKSVLLTTTKRITQANRVKLIDVINTSPQLSKSMFCSFVAKIITIINAEEPFFSACTKCKKAVHEINGSTANCTNCKNGNSDWTIRYNLRLEVNDGTDTAYVTLFDEAEILIGCTAIAYVEMFEDESSECYQKMKSCLEKEYVFLVKINEKEESNRKARCIIAQEVRKVEEIHPPTVETEETGRNKVIDARK
ncbi:replication protein A 70 kDa DNA-binding subunit B-like [Asparagus officinalis]|uniref:replication protein A 70 kDa DNA-binding subunit B-like n=1 Tax=Asparagus officinalis TaxID=4686 RepID=UPI00098E1ECF|nr:replication protein A 70 kDa DNA-binding subunit B-like [Asparagus officinalis]